MPSHCEPNPSSIASWAAVATKATRCGWRTSIGRSPGTFSGEAVTWLPGKPSVRRNVP